MSAIAVYIDHVLRVDWVLLGPGESNKDRDLWQALHAAYLQTHLAAGHETRVDNYKSNVI